MPYARKATAPKPAPTEVEGLHSFRVGQPAVPNNLMDLPDFRPRVADWHIRINRISGWLVLSYKDGCTEAQLRDTANKLRQLASDMDPG